MIKHTAFGLSRKWKEHAINRLYYPNWYMDSIEIFNCMVKRVNQEGMYLGSTGENADRLNSCGEKPYPMRLSNVNVHDNIVDSTGRGGIMLSGADKGNNSIYNNTITRCGLNTTVTRAMEL
jgi:parallel beta-helix repeat protein